MYSQLPEEALEVVDITLIPRITDTNILRPPLELEIKRRIRFGLGEFEKQCNILRMCSKGRAFILERSPRHGNSIEARTVASSGRKLKTEESFNRELPRTA